MRLGRTVRSAVLMAAALSASPAWALGAPGGDLTGWVEDTHGSPVSGAVISIFGRGLARGGLITLTDASGRFSLPSLPPGSYTLRALRSGHAPAPARQVTVLPNQQSIFTLALEPLAGRDGDDAAASSEDGRELKWLVRHKRRSVLEDQALGEKVLASTSQQATPGVPFLGDVGGSLELVASQGGLPGDAEWDDIPSSFGVVRLQGHLAERGTWTLSGLLAESGSTTWRMAAEFVMEPDDDHELQVGTGYGTRYVRPVIAADGSERSVGAVFLQERWQMTENVSATVGGRYSYVGFVDDASHFDPMVSIEVQPDRKVRLHATYSSRTLAPGGDLLAVSSTSAAPMSWAVMDAGLRPERTSRLEMGVDRTVGEWTVGGHTFYEQVSDQLWNTFEGPEVDRSLRIANAGDVSIGGVGVSVGRRFGRLLTGTVTYSLGRTWRGDEALPAAENAGLEGDFHDLATRVETAFDGTDTRIVAYYRLNAIVPEGEGRTQTSRRFDVQVSQGLPFIGSLTRADWDLLLAVRNLFYEIGEGSTLDELSVQNPPKRVLGGIAVRF